MGKGILSYRFSDLPPPAQDAGAGGAPGGGDAREVCGVWRAGSYKKRRDMTSNAISFLSDVSPCTPKRQWILRTPISTNRTGDRFIPNRLTEDVEFSRFQLHTPAKVGPNRETEVVSSSNCKQGNSAMRERLLELKGRSSGNKLLSFKTPCKHSKRGTKSDGECKTYYCSLMCMIFSLHF